MPKGKVVENGKQKVDADPRTRYLNAGADDYKYRARKPLPTKSVVG